MSCSSFSVFKKVYLREVPPLEFTCVFPLGTLFSAQWLYVALLPVICPLAVVNKIIYFYHCLILLGENPSTLTMFRFWCRLLAESLLTRENIVWAPRKRLFSNVAEILPSFLPLLGLFARPSVDFHSSLKVFPSTEVATGRLGQCSVALWGRSQVHYGVWRHILYDVINHGAINFGAISGSISHVPRFCMHNWL